MELIRTILVGALSVVLAIWFVFYVDGLTLGPSYTAEEIHTAHPEWSTHDCERIADGIVWIGMTDEQARVSWGKPTTINKTINASGVREQWVYRYDYSSNYLHFQNGILTSIST